MEDHDGEVAGDLGKHPQRNRRTLTLLIALIVAFWILGTVANALAPTLLAEHPLLLVALEPRNRYLLLTASQVDLVPYVLFATFRRVASDPIYFALGHLYGEDAIAWVENQAGARGARFVQWSQRVFRRFSKLGVFLFPGLLVCMLAGATGMRVRVFLALNIAGTVLAVIVLRAFAAQLEGPVSAITDWNEDNQTWLTGVTIALVAGYLFWQRRRGNSELAAIRELEDHLEGDD